MTPMSIETLLHCYYSLEPLPGWDYPTQNEIVAEFLIDGLIKPTETKGRYAVTERGRAHVHQLCSLVYPVAGWLDGNGKPIHDAT